MFDTAKFGAFIAKLRKNADMTQSELGDRLNLTRQAVSKYECGDSFPDVSILKKISDIFSVSLDLLIGSGEPTEGEAKILEGVASGKDVKAESMSDVVNLAPLLKPSILTKLSESMGKQGMDISHIVTLSEYMRDSDTEQLMRSVTFDSIAEMDMGLLEKLVPMLGDYSIEILFQKVIDGELDYHSLEPIVMNNNYIDSQIESAVVYGVLDMEALDIMRRHQYNRGHYAESGTVIELFLCPKCGEKLRHYHPLRCKCGHKVPVYNCIYHFSGDKDEQTLNINEHSCNKLINAEWIYEKFGKNIIILIPDHSSFEFAPILALAGEYDTKIIVTSHSFQRLICAAKTAKSKDCGQVVFAQMEKDKFYISDNTIDLIMIDSDEIPVTDEMKRVLKSGGHVINPYIQKILWEK